MTLPFSFFDKKRRPKRKLIQQMKSKDNVVAKNAVNTLRKNRDANMKRPAKNGEISNSSIRAEKWTRLAEEDFSGANLQGADISGLGFYLKKANLSNADLRDAILNDTFLEEVTLNLLATVSNSK